MSRSDDHHLNGADVKAKDGGALLTSGRSNGTDQARITKWLFIYWAAFVLGPYLIPFDYYVDASATWRTRALLIVLTTFVMIASLLIGRWLTERLGCEELQLTRGLGLWLLGLLAGALVAWLLGAGMYLTGPLMAGFFGYLGGMAMRRDR